MEYPIRINRYLYLNNICSRRQADRFIEQKLVYINGKPAVLGQQVEEGDTVELKGRAQKHVSNYQYIIYHKPRGVVSHNPQRGEKAVTDLVKSKQKVDPIGRLDKDSTGLMLLSNDGRLVNKMLHPDFSHEKEYVVSVNKELKPSFKKKMEGGVNIEGYVTKPARIKITGDKTFKIILTEGKKHQIRRMCMALGYTVVTLKRVRMMDIKLSKLKEGAQRPLTEKEKSILFSQLGITEQPTLQS